MSMHPPTSRRRLLAGLTGLAALTGNTLLAGCGSDSGDRPDPDRLVLGTNEIMQFDPYLTNTSIHIHTFYSYLADYTPQDTVVPAGAARWTFAPDARSITVELRPARFHDGRPVRARDVVVGVRRAKDPAAAFTMIEPSVFVQGAKELDDRTVRIDFTGPTPEALVLDWMSAFPLIPADQNDPATLENRPAGSGPFRLRSYQRDNRLVLARNPDYFRKDLPRLKEIEYRFFRDEESVVAALESGDLDAASYLGLRHTERLRDRFELVRGAGRMDLFFMNAMLPPFDNKLLRQAVARAIDRDRVLEQVRFGQGEPIYTAFMPGSPAYDERYLSSQQFDLDAAADLLRRSGADRHAVAGVGNEPDAIQILQLIQADLDKIGFRLEIEPMEQTTFLDALFGSQLQCCVAAQPSNLHSPSLVARGRQMLPTKENVLLGDRVPTEYADAVLAARTALGGTAQRRAYAELNRVLVDQAWAVGIVTRPSLTALAPHVRGLRVEQRDNLVLEYAYTTEGRR